MSGDCLENKVLKIEFDVLAHNKQIESLVATTIKVEDQVEKISTTLTHIQYTAYGALGFFVIEQIGFLGAIKHIFGQ